MLEKVDWERIADTAKIAVVALLATEPKFVVLAIVLFVFDLLTGLILTGGRLNRTPVKHVKNSLGFFLRWSFVLLVLTMFANAFAVTGWIVEAAYIFVCGKLVQRNFFNMTATDSDVRQFFNKLWDEVQRRNLRFVNSDETPDEEDSTEADTAGPTDSEPGSGVM